jgi:hypothetical protein
MVTIVTMNGGEMTNMLPRSSFSVPTAGSVWDRHITMPVPQFLGAAGFGRTKCYELIGSGDLETILIGRRRLVVVDSYRRLIERQQAAAD